MGAVASVLFLVFHDEAWHCSNPPLNLPPEGSTSCSALLDELIEQVHFRRH